MRNPKDLMFIYIFVQYQEKDIHIFCNMYKLSSELTFPLASLFNQISKLYQFFLDAHSPKAKQ